MEWIRPIFPDFEVPSDPGVYAFVNFENPFFAKFIYIGKSENIHTRRREHLEGRGGHPKLKKYLDDHPKTEFWYILEDIAKLDALEEEKIREHKPLLNKMHNR